MLKKLLVFTAFMLAGLPFFYMARLFNNFLLWRFLFWFINTRIYVSVLSVYFQIVAKLCVSRFASELIEMIKQNLSQRSLQRSKTWRNYFVEDCFCKIKRQMSKNTSTPQRPLSKTADRKINVVMVGAFSGLLSFPKKLFEKYPEQIELRIFDLPYYGSYAYYLEQITDYYHQVRISDSVINHGDYLDMAEKINKMNADVVINIARDSAYSYFDFLTSPCIVHICTGSNLLHHPKTSFQIYCQPLLGFFPSGNHLFCGISRSLFKSQFIYPGFIFFDDRGIDSHSVKPYQERSKTIVFHGNLHKLASVDFLNVLFSLMADDSSLDFAFMGLNRTNELEVIFSMAQEYGVKPRVHYEGNFFPGRDPSGDIHDPGWGKCLAMLNDARLHVNPWPVGGASARFECYAMKVPVAHLGMRYDSEVWGKNQPSIIDLPDLNSASGTVYDSEQYAALCMNCLYDENFAAKLVAEQLQIVKRLSNPDNYWNQLIGFYKDWESQRLKSNS